jgi:predicted small secreted protein
MRLFLLTLAACFAIAGLAGCNTMRGFGEDISALGRSLSNSTGTGSSH